jgi:CheY-like chemotaxis protein
MEGARLARIGRRAGRCSSLAGRVIPRCILNKVAKRAERPSARVFRPARTPVPGIGAKLGDLACTVTNLSSSGAMLRSGLEVPVGREVTLVFDLPNPVITNVRVVRCEPVDVPLPAKAVWRQHDFALGVHFLKHHDELAAAIRSLAKQAGIEHSQARVLVLGRDDEVSRLVDKALSDAEYTPRVLTHPRYAVSTAKRIGAKAIVITLDIDPQLSARTVLDTLRADSVTAAMPIILCARQASLQHQRYVDDRRLQLLSVPFTSEDLVAAVDRAIDELS